MAPTARARPSGPSAEAVRALVEGEIRDAIREDGGDIAFEALEGRTVRAILSDHDGVDFLLAYHNDLLYDAETFEEGIGHTERLRARAKTELDRVGRRERYARTYLQRQQGAFGF